MDRRRDRWRRWALGSVAVLAVAALGCSDGDDGSPGGEAATTSTSVPTSVPESTTTTPSADPEWVMHETDEDCMCADGSDYVFFSRANDPEKVVLYFQGGGACFSLETCGFEDGSYKVTTGAEDDPTDAGGIFDFDDPDNPFADWSMVFVPYCTGDVHLGDATTEYGPELTVEHNGFVNASTGLDFLVEEFPDAAEVVVTGSSAGGVPSPLFGGLAADALPDARVAVLADASGGYASNPPVNEVIGQLWGVTDIVPDWPEFEGVAPSEIGLPDLFSFTGDHDPSIRMARFDNANDAVQRTFAALAGTGDDLPAVLDQNERLVEDRGTDLSVYIAPGDGHTILGRPALYDLTVEGTPLIDWLTEFVEGGVPGDVRCVDCGAPSAGG